MIELTKAAPADLVGIVEVDPPNSESYHPDIAGLISEKLMPEGEGVSAVQLMTDGVVPQALVGVRKHMFGAPPTANQIEGYRTEAELLVRLRGGATTPAALAGHTGDLTAVDFGVIKRENVVEALKMSMMYDQCMVSDSAAFEMLLGKARTIKYANQERRREDGGPKGGSGGKRLSVEVTLTVEEPEAFSGVSQCGVTVAYPKLLKYVKEDIAKRSGLLKGMFKARRFGAAVVKK